MRDAVTTGLELLAVLLLATAIALFVSAWSVPGGLAAAGLFLFGASAVITSRARRIAARGARNEDTLA